MKFGEPATHWGYLIGDRIEPIIKKHGGAILFGFEQFDCIGFYYVTTKEQFAQWDRYLCAWEALTEDEKLSWDTLFALCGGAIGLSNIINKKGDQ